MSMAKCKLTKMTTASVHRSPILDPSMLLAQYAKRGMEKTATLCHKVSIIVSQNNLEL
jgi:hypothetical protein